MEIRVSGTIRSIKSKEGGLLCVLYVVEPSIFTNQSWWVVSPRSWKTFENEDTEIPFKVGDVYDQITIKQSAQNEIPICRETLQL